MMKRTIMTLVWLSLTVSIEAQNSGWTMEQCMSYAVRHSENVMKKQYERASADEDYKAAKAAFFPSLTAQTGGAYNWGRSVDPETNTYNNITTFNNAYDLYTSLKVFDGGQVLNQWKQAKVLRSRGLSEWQKAKDDKAISVMQAFVEAVYCQACIGVAGDKLTDSRSILKKAEREQELGSKSMPDVAQVKAQVAEDEYALTHQRNLFQAALLALKSEMNFPVGDSLALNGTFPIEKPQFSGNSPMDVFRFAQEQNPAAILARLNVESSKLQYKIEKGKLMPSLTLSAGFATSYYRNLSGEATAFSFGSQFRNNMGEYVSATLTIPLFDNLRRRSSWRKAKNNLLVAELEQSETLRKLQTDIRQAILDRDGYAQEIRQLEAKVNADSLAYSVTRRKFEEGMVGAIDLRSNANTLLLSRVSLLQKRLLYALKVRLVDYYKSGELIK